MKTLADEPAFPANFDHGTGIESVWGMSYRQYASCKIMAGFAADISLSAGTGPEQIAELAVAWADALIAALDAPAKTEWTAEQILTNEG